MKITEISITIEEKDFEAYEENLVEMGWKAYRNHLFRKQFGTTNAEIRESIPTFSTKINLLVTIEDPQGCSVETIRSILNELDIADQTPDD